MIIMSEGVFITVIITVFSLLGAIGTLLVIKEINNQVKRQRHETADKELARSHEYEKKSWKHMGRLSLYYIGSALLILIFFLIFYR